MASAIEFGSTREVWFATLAAPNTKYSFLIRDDAFTKSGVVFGRTVRLGDAINTGPGSGWRQTSWEGGNNQKVWKDPVMFDEGTADMYSHYGRLRLWPGWGHIQKDATRKFDSYSMAPSNSATTAFGNTLLFLGERNVFYTGGAPAGGFKAYKYDPAANSMTQLPATPTTLGGTGYTAIVGATDDASAAVYTYFGTGGGLWLYLEPGNSWAQDTNAPATGVNFDSMACFRDALYFLSGQSLYKRTPLVGAFGVLGTHTKVKTHQACYTTRGLAIWNNRIWYGIQFAGNRVALGSSDGVTAQQVIEMPEEFVILKLVAHYGALYIFGGKPQAVAGTKAHPAAVNQVWKYTGSSMTKLWESNDEDLRALTDAKPHLGNGACSFGPILCWANPGFAGTVSPRPEVMMYDAERDAFFEGPQFETDPQGIKDGFAVTSMCAWNNSIVVGYHDFHDYTKNGAVGVDWPTGVAYLRMPNFTQNKHLRQARTFAGRSVEHPNTSKMQFVRSSRYRGEDSVAAELKTWLSGKVICRLADKYCQLKVYIITNERERYLVKTIDFDATNTGWRTVKFGITNPGAYEVYNADGSVLRSFPPYPNQGTYLQSTIVQYEIQLVSNAIGIAISTSTPEVDAIEIGWMVAPTKRRQYHMRMVLEDAQFMMDRTTPNALTTAQAQADQLEALWSSAVPFRMWGPFGDTKVPAVDLTAGNAIEVVPTAESFQVQQYRVESNDTQVAQEVGLTLIENVVL